jgi:hypothetical protein
MNRLENAVNKYGEIADFKKVDKNKQTVKIIHKKGIPVKTIQDISKWDPSGNNKYLDWILSRKTDTSLTYKTLKEFVSFFHTSPSKFTKKNIYQYQDENDIMNDLKNIPNKLSKSEIKKFGATIVNDTPEYKIVIPTTYLATKMYGSATKWCITTDKSKVFEKYASINQIYIVIIKDKSIINEKVGNRYHKLAILISFIDHYWVTIYDALDKSITKSDLKKIYNVDFLSICQKHFLSMDIFGDITKIRNKIHNNQFKFPSKNIK